MTRESTPSGWDAFVAEHTVGDAVAVTVTRTLPFGCLVEAPGGVPGLLRGTSAASVGDHVDARIEAIDPAERRISLVSA